MDAQTWSKGTRNWEELGNCKTNCEDQSTRCFGLKQRKYTPGVAMIYLSEVLKNELSMQTPLKLGDSLVCL